MSNLTAPHDRDPTAPKRRLTQGVSLTETQVQAAADANIDMSYVDKFPRLDKFYADPVYNNQVYCTHSFVPSKGATPDREGVFGFMKCRGAFQTDQEAYQRSEWIIRNCDSMNSLQTTYVGRPFPVCADHEKYVKETVEIDLKKKTIETQSEDIKEKRLSEKQEIKDIKQREENLLAESKDDFIPDPLDRYIETHVRRANLIWAYNEGLKKMAEMKASIIKARGELAQMDGEFPDFREKYMTRYMNARKESGFPDVDPNAENNFIKYMVEDLDLGF
ncbi:hypothetical protein OAV62_02170 [bacterium]|nr:hypothetical protein [bacterium]